MADGATEHAALMLGGALNHDFFHDGHAYSANPYSPPMVSSPAAISPEDLDILDSSHVLHPLDHDMLLSSFGSSATAGDDYDEWVLPSDMNFKSELPPSLSSSAQHATLSPPVLSSENFQSPIPETGGEVCLSWLLEENQSMHPSSTAKASLPQTAGTSEVHEVRKSSSQSDVTRQFDLCDHSDAMEDDESDKTGPNGKPSLSKNLVSERRRRKKLNERLYSLRAIVPRISKMDKASIVGDAITYVQELKQQIEDMQNDILTLESSKVTLRQGSADCVQFGTSVSAKHKILHLDVSKMEEHTYHLRIHCKKGPGALVQLTRALEALDLEILNANLTAVGDHILNTIIVKVKIDEVLKPEELKEMFRGITPKYNLQF